MSQCSQLVAQAPRDEVFLNQVCHLLTDTGQYRLAWIGLARGDPPKTVAPVAQAGYEDSYLESINISWDKTSPLGQGPTGRAIQTGTPQVIRNILTNPTYAVWRDQALKRGYASSVALPISVDLKIIGALNVYAAEPDAFDSDEVTLLSRLAHEIGYGLKTLQERTEQEQTKLALRQSLEQFHQLFDEMPDAYARHQIICDESGQPIDYRYLEINRAFERSTGLSGDIIGRSILELLPETEHHWIERYGNVALTGIPVQFEELSQAIGNKWFDVVAYSPAPGQFVTVFRDITRQKKAEERLRLLSLAVEQSPAAIIITDINGNIQYTNQRFTQVTGYHL
jgi:PAS domain S-box-containing protein